MEKFPKFYNEKMETIGSEELHAIQESKFLKQVKYMLENSLLYQRKFKEAGLELGDIRGLDDLDKIPFTEKVEIRASQAEAPPLGTHAACPRDKVMRIYSSSGTSGAPTYIGLTKHDLEDVWLEISPRSYYTAGVRPDDTVVFTINIGPFVAGAAFNSFERIGATTIPLGSGNTERLIGSFQKLGATVLLGTPSYAEYLITWCQKHGIDTQSLGIKKINVAGEPGGSIPAVRNKIESAFNAVLTEAMGIADMSISIWGECPDAKEGMHFSGMEFMIPQIIDPDTGKTLEWKDGATGELVYTAIDRECCPLLRFRSRDHVVVWSSPCICGRTSPRLRCTGRTDDMLIVLAVNVFPSAIKDVVNSFRPRTSGEIQIQLEAPPPKVEPPLKIKVEQGAEPGDLGQLKKELETVLRAKLVFRADVELVPEASLPRFEYKAKLIRKLYEEK